MPRSENRIGRFKTPPARCTDPGNHTFQCPGCGGHYATTEMCEDCEVCVTCCEPGCACDGCLTMRADA